MAKSEGDRAPSLLIVLDARYPTTGGGGAESQVHTLAAHFKGRGVAVSICSPVFQGLQATRTVEVNGIPMHRLDYPRWPVAGAIIMLLKLALLIWNRRREIDVIHAHIAGNMAAVSCLVGKLLGIPVVVKLTGMTELVGGILDDHINISTRIRRWAIQRATHVQAISRRIAQLLLDAGFRAEQVHYIPNAVDMGRFSPSVDHAALPGPIGIETRRFVGIFVGRMSAEKNIEMLLSAWARCFSGREDTALLMIGDGPQKDAMKATAAQLGIGEQVHFFGAVSAVQDYLPLAHVGILTSKAEGLSNSLLEYMSCGLPVIGSIVSGNEDLIIPGETGWLFESSNEDQLTECLEQAHALAGRKLRTLGHQARQRISQQAGLPTVAAKLLELYGFESSADGLHALSALRGGSTSH